MYFIALILFFASLANAAAPTVAITDPDGDGNYLRQTQIITFTVTDTDANSNADANLFADIYVSATAGAKTTLVINDLNLMNTARCGDQNFVTQNTCTIDFNFATHADGNFFLDVNVADWTPAGVVRDSALDSSAGSFTIDSGAPVINFISPTAGQTVVSKVMRFDVNDSRSPITLSSIAVKLNGVTSSAFTSGACSLVGDKNYLCSYTETGISSNQDYNLTVSASDFATNASGDSNRSFTYDSSVSAVTITYPSQNFVYINVFDSTVTYSNPDSDIAKYWVWIDNSSVIDNGTNTSYIFAGLTLGTHTINVIAMDNLDNNSVTASVIFSISAGGGSGVACGNLRCDGTESAATCPTDCSPVCGDNVCTGTESVNTCPADCGPAKVCGNDACEAGENYNLCPQDCEPPKGQKVREIILSRETKGKPGIEDMRKILEAAGASENALDKAVMAHSKAESSRKFEVIREEDVTGERFTTIVEIAVKNNSGREMRNVKVMEEIPKEALESAKNIASSAQFRVIKDDPIVEFTIESIRAGESKSIKYSIDDALTSDNIDSFRVAPIIADFSEGEKAGCSALNCNDGNACTNDSCENSACLNIPKSDGTSCGAGLACKDGTCVASQVQELAGDGSGGNAWLLAGAIAIIAALGYIFFIKK